eukprot:gene16129-biopygen6737
MVHSLRRASDRMPGVQFAHPSTPTPDQKWCFGLGGLFFSPRDTSSDPPLGSHLRRRPTAAVAEYVVVLSLCPSTCVLPQIAFKALGPFLPAARTSAGRQHRRDALPRLWQVKFPMQSSPSLCAHRLIVFQSQHVSFHVRDKNARYW